MIVTNPMFFDENNKISDYARKKYGVENGQKVFNTVTLPSDKVKAIPNEVFLKELSTTNHDCIVCDNNLGTANALLETTYRFIPVLQLWRGIEVLF
jgi:hypothetical protein